MKLVILSVKDTAIQSFGTPMFVTHLGGGIRSFSDEVNRKAEGNQLYAHSTDFELWALGEFDTDNGRFDSGEPRCVTRGVDVRIKE